MRGAGRMKKVDTSPLNLIELYVQCQRCLTTESLTFTPDGAMTPTARFRQEDGRVIHFDGGLCHLYPMMVPLTGFTSGRVALA